MLLAPRKSIRIGGVPKSLIRQRVIYFFLSILLLELLRVLDNTDVMSSRSCPHEYMVRGMQSPQEN